MVSWPHESAIQLHYWDLPRPSYMKQKVILLIRIKLFTWERKLLNILSQSCQTNSMWYEQYAGHFSTQRKLQHMLVSLCTIWVRVVIACSLSSLPIWHTPSGTAKNMHNAMISACISLKQFLNDKGIDQAFRNTRWIPRALPLPRKIVGNIKLHHISSTKLVVRINDTWTNEKNTI
jgi:hypothetical protein